LLGSRYLQPEVERAPIDRVVVSQAASPMVKAGKMMWKLTKANWMRETSTESRSISVSRHCGNDGLVRRSVFQSLGHQLDLNSALKRAL
jgi:hypothetical protein